MKRAHARVISALREGFSVTVLAQSKYAWVSRWVSYGVYEDFRVRLSTIRELESAGVVKCVDEYSYDREWVLNG